MCYYLFFFFKQKTAYEMRISDWSSDVCSSDLFIMMGYMNTETASSLTIPTTKTVLAALKPGQRHIQALPPGSGDAWWLADLARASRKTVVVLCADPLAAQRLAEEVLLFAPDLRGIGRASGRGRVCQYV